MLTLKIDDSTFVIKDKTYKVGDTVKLTESEELTLTCLNQLSKDIEKLRAELLTACVNVFETFVEKYADKYVEYDSMQKQMNFQSSQLMTDICNRLGGLLPLHLALGFQPLVRVRQLSPNEAGTIVTMDNIRMGIGFERAISDARIQLAGLVGGTVPETADKIKCLPQNWKLMGCPYVTMETKDIAGFDFLLADQYEEFKWEEIEKTCLDHMMTQGVVASLGSPQRVNALRTNQFPYPLLVTYIGPKETLTINLSDVPEHQRAQLLQRESLRTQAKYILMAQFGPLSQEGSTHDFEVQNAKQGNPIGFTLSVIMQSVRGHEIRTLMGAKGLRFDIHPERGVMLNIYTIFEGNPGTGDLNMKRFFESLLVTKPELVQAT